MLNFYVKWTLNIHQKNFEFLWQVLAITEQCKRNCHFSPIFFQALVLLAGSAIGRNFGSARSANTHVSHQKNFRGRISNIENNLRGNPLFFHPPTNPNRDHVPFYAKRIVFTGIYVVRFLTQLQIFYLNDMVLDCHHYVHI